MKTTNDTESTYIWLWKQPKKVAYFSENTYRKPPMTLKTPSENRQYDSYLRVDNILVALPELSVTLSFAQFAQEKI